MSRFNVKAILLKFSQGANSGVAFHTVEKFVQSSHYHVIMGVRSLHKGEAALKDIKSRSPAGTMSLQELDITSQSSINTAAGVVQKEYGRIDVLINSAGIIVMDARDLSDKLQRTFETNVFSQALMTQAFKPLLKASKSATPRLIFVSSDLGSVSLRRDINNYAYRVTDSEYRMSKSALNMLAACYEEEFTREEGLQKAKVFVFNPGYVVTNLSGEEGVEMRKKTGAGDPRESARVLVETAEGKRDEDQKHGMVNANSSATWFPW